MQRKIIFIPMKIYMLCDFNLVKDFSTTILGITDMEYKTMMNYEMYWERFKDIGYFENFFYECYMLWIDIRQTNNLRNKWYTLTEIKLGRHIRWDFVPKNLFDDTKLNTTDSLIDNNNSVL